MIHQFCVVQKYMMIKDNINKKVLLYFKRMTSCLFFLILVNMLIPSVKSVEMSAKRCFLYPIDEYKSSPWFTIPLNHDTIVLLENMPMSAPVNITIKKYDNKVPDIYCLLSVRLNKINIYGNCLDEETQSFPLNGNITEKILVFHVQETLFQISVEDVMVNLIQSIANISGQNHTIPERMDNGDLSEENEMKIMMYNTQYMTQITADISEEKRLHAAIGCEYDTDDECTLEIGNTILIVKDQITLMAFSNSSKLDGKVLVHYGNSDFKRSKPLRLTLPNFEDVESWEEVATIVPTFMDRGEDKEGYILILDSSFDLMYSPRNPGLVGTVIEKELILDFTGTKNIRWGVPCPEKPKSLRITTTVITTTPENDAEIFIPVGDNEVDDTDLLLSMVRKEPLRDNVEVNSASQPELELELQLESEAKPEHGLYEEPGIAARTSKAPQHVTGATMSICRQLLMILTGTIIFLFYTCTDITY